MPTMTLNEYLNYALVKALAKHAERDGIEIVDEKPRLRLMGEETVVMLRQEPEASADDAA